VGSGNLLVESLGEHATQVSWSDKSWKC
jgi:hypothetical protein